MTSPEAPRGGMHKGTGIDLRALERERKRAKEALMHKKCGHEWREHLRGMCRARGCECRSVP